MRLLYLALLITCLNIRAGAQVFGGATTGIPADAVAPEDAAFNTTYLGRKVPSVTGKLLNLSAGELNKLTIEYTLVTPFSQSQFQQTKPVVVRLDGSFCLQLDNALPYQQMWFNINDVSYTTLYVNTDLFLELDMKKLKSSKDIEFSGEGVRYLGTDGPLNTYLNNYEFYKKPERDSLYTRASTM